MDNFFARLCPERIRFATLLLVVSLFLTGAGFGFSVAWGQSGFAGYAAPGHETSTTQPSNASGAPQSGQHTQPAQGGVIQPQQSMGQSAGQAQGVPVQNVPGPAQGSVSSPSGGYITTPTANQIPPAAAQPAFLPPPFELSQNDQFRLNEFLSHWENFGKGIKRVSCDVHVREFDGGVFNQNSGVPMSHTWGQFRYISPNKLLYHIRGEYSYIAKAGEDPKPEWKASSNESKIIYDGKSLTQYDYRKKTATVFPIVKEEWNDDLSMDGPFPLFFIANAKKLQDRFYMRIVTPQDKVQSDVWIEAFPRYPGDAQEFKSIIVLLRLSDLQPYHLRRTRINGKSYSDLEFQNVAINKGLWNIEASVDLGWKKTMEMPISLRQRRMATAGTAPATSGIIPAQTTPGAVPAPNATPSGTLPASVPGR